MLRFGIMHDRSADEVHRSRGSGAAGQEAAAIDGEGHDPEGEAGPEADLEAHHAFKEQSFAVGARVRHMLRGMGTVVELANPRPNLMNQTLTLTLTPNP